MTGNVGKRIGHNGVTLQKGGGNATISGNTFVDMYRGPSDEPSDEDGCRVYIAGLTDSVALTVVTWAENINVSGNTIVNPARGGILVRAGVRSCLIQGNTIINPGSEFLADGVTPTCWHFYREPQLRDQRHHRRGIPAVVHEQRWVSQQPDDRSALHHAHGIRRQQCEPTAPSTHRCPTGQ